MHAQKVLWTLTGLLLVVGATIVVWASDWNEKIVVFQTVFVLFVFVAAGIGLFEIAAAIHSVAKSDRLREESVIQAIRISDCLLYFVTGCGLGLGVDFLIRAFLFTDIYLAILGAVILTLGVWAVLRE